MAKLTLQVIGDVSDVEKKIQAVETKLTQKPIKIKVEATGVDAVTKDLIQYAKWSAKATAAEADLQRQKSKTEAATARQSEALSKYKIQVERTNTEVQRTATEQARLKTQTERTNTEIERQVTQEKRLETQQERTNTEIERNKRALDDAGKAAEKTGAQFNLLSGILQRLQSAAISAVVRSLRDAISTLKDVDDQLVTVRKVTEFSAEQIQQIKDQAFEVASAYGQTADAYLESVAAFSRAGYKEQASDLAELATKTQIVGDTTAEVANQFLISVDAAYKYGGSIKELSKVLDGANEIDNKYATSIEKIASGMGIVAPVAAQMHVSVDELAASIGTITAVTQRSGTEAARALRALFLNIAGDTKTEIDEGVTWTTGEIEGLRDVIKMYAKDAYDAAQATGSIIDPMRAMEGLAKSMQEGVLTEQKLIEMVSDIGGKLRTSQLLAIIQNWDMYQSMLQDYAGAIGSADREVENALDSWTRKTNILKNTTAEFVNRLVDTSLIKGGIDFITGIVKTLDNAVVVFQKLTGAIDMASESYAEHSRKLEDLQQQYDALNIESGELQTLKANVDSLTEAELQRLGVLQSQSAELDKQIKKEKEQAFYAWRGDHQTGIRYAASSTGTLDVQYYNKLEGEVTNAQLAFAKLDATYRMGKTTQDAYIQGVKNLITSMSQNAEAIQKGKDAGVELTDAETRLLNLYERLTTIVGQDTVETEKNAAAKAANAKAAKESANYESLFAKAMEEVENKSSLTYGTIKQLDAIYPGFSAKILDASGNLTAEGKAALSSKSALVDLIGTMISANATGMSFEGQIAALMELAAAAGIASDAVASIFSGVGGPSFGDDGQIDVGAEKAYARSKANPTRTINKLLDDMKSTLKNSEYAKTNDNKGGGGGSSEDATLTALKEIVSFRKAELSFLEASGASVADQVAKQREIQAALHDQAEYLRQTEGETANVLALSTEWWNIQEKISKLLEDDTVAPLKEIVDLEKQRLTYIKASGASEEEQIAQMRQVQASLKAQEAEMRRIGADEKEILAVATEWHNIENDIVDLQDKIAQQLRDEIAQTLSDIVDSLKDAEDAMISPLQAQLDALNAAHDAVQERREEEEKILAVEKARIALENAQRERTVRQYNSKTGSWEWVANAKNVESAQKALADANADLSKYYAEKEYDAAKTALEAQITNTKSAFSALRDAMNEAAQAIKDGKMSYEEAYAYIQNAMHDIYDDYGVDLTGVLNTSVKEFGKVNTAIKGLLSTLGKDTQAAANQAMANLDGTEDDINTGLGLFTLYMQNALKTNDPEKAIKELCDAINQGVVTDLHSVSDILKALNGDYAGISASTAKLWALTKMQANSIAWHMTSDANTQAALHAENMQLGTAIGLSYNSATGTWHDKSGQQVYTLNAVNGAWTSTLNGDAAGGTSTGTSAGSGGTLSQEAEFYSNPNTSEYYKTPKQVTVEKDESGNVIAYSVVASDGERVRVSKDDDQRAFEFVDSAAKGSPVADSLGGASRKYLYSILRKDDGTYAVIGHDRATGEQEFRFFDQGGILHGTGAIKATASDEMVLPPGMTARLLNAEMTGAFDSLLRHLGIVTAAADSIAGFGGGLTRSSIGEQHNGDVFYIDGIELKNITGSTTLNDLARCAKNLALQRGS